MEPFKIPTFYILFAEKGNGKPTAIFTEAELDKCNSEAKRIAIQTDGFVHRLKCLPDAKFGFVIEGTAVPFGPINR